MSAAERMERLRQKRKKEKIKEVRFWVREEDLDKAKKITSVFQKLALYNEAQEDTLLLEEKLKSKLEEFGSWEEYLKEKYDFNLEPSTEKQRKFALRLAAAAKENLPLEVLKHKGLLSSWIRKKMKRELLVDEL